MSPMISAHRKRFFVRQWMISAIVSLALLLWKTPMFAGSFSVGCAAMILNFYILFSLLDGLMDQENPKHTTYLLLLMGKFVGLGLAVFLLGRFVNIDLVAFGLGFFLVAISATYATGRLQKQ